MLSKADIVNIPFTDISRFSKILSSIENSGIALIKGIGSTNEFVEFARKIGAPIIHRDSGKDGIITLQPQEKESRNSFIGFTRNKQYLHTDGTTIEKPANVLALYCEKPSPRGGESTLLDGEYLYHYLNRLDPELLGAMEEKDAAVFGDPKSESRLSPIFQNSSSGLISIHFRNDKLVKYSPLIKKKHEALIKTMDSLTAKVKLDEGQGYVIDNRKFIHGRTAFKRNRIIHRVQLHSLPNIKLTAGFTLL